MTVTVSFSPSSRMYSWSGLKSSHGFPLTSTRWIGAPWGWRKRKTTDFAGRRAGIKRCFCKFGFGEARGETYELAIDRMDACLAVANQS